LNRLAEVDLRGRIIGAVEFHLASGDSWRQLRRTLQDSLEVTKSRAQTVARTEMAAAMVEGTKLRYEAEGIQQVQWQAVGSSRTCGYCAPRHGKVYKLGDVVAPAHPNCRCTVTPWDPEWEELGLIDPQEEAKARAEVLADLEAAGKKPISGPTPFEKSLGMEQAPKALWTPGLQSSLEPVQKQTRTPKTKSASTKSNAKDKPLVDVSQMRRAKPGGEYGPDGHWYPGGAFISDGKYQGNVGVGKGDSDAVVSGAKDDKGKSKDAEPQVLRNRKTAEPRPLRPTAATGLEKPSGMKALLKKRDQEYFDQDGFLTEDIEKAARKAGDGRSPLENTGFMTALVNRAKPEWIENKIAAIRQVVGDVADFDYYVQDARDQAVYEYQTLKRGATTASEAEYAAGQGLLQAVFQLAGERLAKKKGGSRIRSANEEVIWIMNNVLMTKRRA
jgi:SPP1 gp7 family putative phage head morphogenesis protein